MSFIEDRKKIIIEEIDRIAGYSGVDSYYNALEDFPWMSVQVLKSKNISPNAKVLYAALAHKSCGGDVCTPSTKEICEVIGVTRRHFYNLTNELEEYGFITRDSKPGKLTSYGLIYEPEK